MRADSMTKDDGSIARQHLQFLKAEIETASARYQKQRRRNEKNAVVIRFLALFLSAVVTIILGLNLQPPEVWNGVALTLSALTGVVSGFSSFFDFNALAIKFKDTEDKLNMLRIKLEYLALRDDPIDDAEVDTLRDEYLHILEETYDFYQSVKKEDSEEQKGRRFQEARHG